MQAVARHLWARSFLARGEHAPARAAGLSSLASWDDVTTEIALADPQMVGRAHAFHAQLASRHSAAYRNFRSEEHTSELQSLMRISYAVFCLKKKHKTQLVIHIIYNTNTSRILRRTKTQ